MKNNKGFTLIELLVVIVILVGISLIAVPNISSSLSKRKNKQIEQDKEILLEYAQLYASNDIDIYNCLKGNGYISLQELAELKKIEIKSMKQYQNTNYGYAIYENNTIVYSDNSKSKNCIQ